MNEGSDTDMGSSHSTPATEYSQDEGVEIPEGETLSSRGSIYSTFSLESGVLRYHFENGRRYHAYHEGKYIMPNDEAELNKLLMVHHAYTLAFDGRLHFAPIGDYPQSVLDVGCGGGEWAMDFAEKYPSARVIGTDLSPVQPSWAPPNVQFIVDDAEDEWIFNSPFDFIHTRTLCGAIQDWSRFHQQASENLKPGGWIEMQENEAWFQCEDGTLPHFSKVFLENLAEASRLSGRKLNAAADQKQHMIDAGFVNVTDTVWKLPLAPWPDEPKWKQIGWLRGQAMNWGVEGYSLALYTRYLGWSWNEVQVLLANVRNEFNNMNNRMYIAVHIITGQKPACASL